MNVVFSWFSTEKLPSTFLFPGARWVSIPLSACRIVWWPRGHPLEPDCLAVSRFSCVILDKLLNLPVSISSSIKQGQVHSDPVYKVVRLESRHTKGS